MRHFEIPAQPVSSAIPEFGRQAQVQILVSGAETQNLTSRPLRGNLDARSALAELISGTGLQVVSDDGRVITLGRAPAPMAATKIQATGLPPRPAQPAAAPPEAAPDINAGQGAALDLLGEVVVTATRQADTVSRVPLSVTAVSQKSLDQQGVKNVSDIARTVPSVTFRRVGGEGNPQIAVRGIFSNLGASTTGVYLDDTPLQKRGTNGAVTGNGSPVPLLFDLERVEVLRGPQGTLFGSGSEGGTLRFITPSPSLNRYSGYGRAEISTTEGGGMGYEAGVAMGGPIVMDKLGFRASVYGKHIGGVLDHVSIYDGHEIAKNTDRGNQKALRLAVTWAVTDRLRVTPAVYLSYDHAADQGASWQNVPAFTTQGGTFTNRVRVGEPATTPNSTGFNLDFPNTTIPGFSFGPYPFFGDNKTPVAYYFDQNCGACTAYTPFGPATITTAATTINGVTYPARVTNIPGQQMGPNKAVLATSPRTNTLRVPSLTLDYQFEHMAVKSITSYAQDSSKGFNGGQFGGRAAFSPTSTATPTTVGGAFTNAAGANVVGGITGTPLFPLGLPPLPAPGTGGNYIIIPGLPLQQSEFHYVNRRNQFTQELRFSSDTGPDVPLTWVAGVFYSSAQQYQRLYQNASEAFTSYYLRGLDESFTLNAYNMGTTQPLPVAIDCSSVVTGVAPNATYNCVQTQPTTITTNDVARRYVHIKESEVAAFGEANYMLTSKLKATLGARYARSKNDYLQELAGSVFGSPFSPTFVPRPPTAADTDGLPYPVAGDGQYYTITSGSQTESPFNPKVGLSYQADERNLFYVTAAKGYRAGGVNAPVSQGNCAAQLAALNITGSPIGYDSDSVTSYEGGAKLRVLGVQLNSSVFYIDWKNPQLTVQLTCGSSYITNAGKAVSQGFDVQTQARILGFTLSGSLAYTDAKYTRDVTNATPTGTPSYIVHKDDPLPVSKWQYAVSAQYDFRIMQRFGAYLRADYQYSGKYFRNLANNTAYDPLTTAAEPTHFMTARAGVSFSGWDVNAYVNNLTNSKDRLTVAHGSGAAQVTYQQARPREFGLQAAYRY
jgi:outer membrane receptor protein involved in Fe transport